MQVATHAGGMGWDSACWGPWGLRGVIAGDHEVGFSFRSGLELVRLGHEFGFGLGLGLGLGLEGDTVDMVLIIG